MKIDEFLKIEEKYDLFDKKVDGVNFWIYARAVIWNYRICTETMQLAAPHPGKKRTFFEYCGAILTIAKNCLRKKHIGKNGHDVCFIGHERRVKVDDYFECVYTEGISEVITNSVTLETPYKGTHFHPVKKPHKLIYTDYIVWWGIFWCLFHEKLKTTKYKRIYKSVQQIMREPLEEIKKVYHLNLDLDECYHLCTTSVLSVQHQYPLYKKLIARINPKLIVEVVYYSEQCMMVNQVAKELGIKTIELQHGTMYDNHAAYQYGTDKSMVQLPQEIYTFSEYWNDFVHMPQSTKVTAMGYPYFEKQRNKYLNDSSQQKKICNILFISQGTISEELSKLAVELERLLDSKKYHIIYKLHPGEYADWKERCKWLIDTNIEVVDSFDKNIYEYFAMSSIQVGAYSTAVYEGLGFGLRTYLYDIAHARALSKLVDKGYADFVHSAEELCSKIINDSYCKVDVESIWKTDAQNNIIAGIRESMICIKEQNEYTKRTEK